MNTIKITSGKYRGRSISTPGGKTHPMGERERLALFNIISSYLPGATVLDAYAGSGALGIEALSRGASHATFIEKSPQAIRTIHTNLSALNISDDCDVFHQDVKGFSTEDSYDIILLDPPYSAFETSGAASLAKFLRPSGVLVLSHPDEAPAIDGLELISTHKYAAAHLSLYAHSNDRI